MERNFYNNDFEKLLKENADQFNMLPSKKVWYGIYNDLHPGTRWPSVAMSIFFIFTLVIIGHLNTQQPEYTNSTRLHNQKNKNPDFIKSASNALNPISGINNPVVYKSISRQKNGVVKKNVFKSIKSDQAIAIAKSLTDEPDNFNQPENNFIQLASDIARPKNIDIILPEEHKKIRDGFDNALVIKKPADLNEPADFMKSISVNNENEERDIKRTIENINVQTKIDNANIYPEFKNQINKAVHNLRRKPGKIKWSYFFTPSVSYRIISKNNTPAVNAISTGIVPPYNGNVINHVEQRAAPGFEAGAIFKYPIYKKLKFISGFQLNYSSYRIQANNIHPMLATIVLNSAVTGRPYAVSDISFFSNGPGSGQVNLHNYSFQASVPVGLEYTLAGNNYIKLSTAATFQPSYVIANHSYLLSSDKRNYITAPSLLRTWNMNTSAGVFIAFKSKWLDMQVGPQVRYQLLSTYTRAYPVSEHLIDYGIRFRFSKTIK